MAPVHHDDAEREWAYDRKSNVGRLDKAWDEAVAKGWIVVSMKDDWKTISHQLGSSNNALSQDCNYDRIVIRGKSDGASA